MASSSENAPFQEKISLELRDADIRLVIRSFAVKYGLNIVAPDTVQGKISVSLQDVPVDDALGLILELRDLTFIKENGVYKVLPLVPEAKQTVTRMYKPNSRSVKDLKSVFDNMLSKDGKIFVDEQSNTLFISDNPQIVNQIDNYLAEVDAQENFQVTIEARFVEVQVGAIRNLGIQWGTVGTPGAVITDAETTRAPEIGIGFVPSTSLRSVTDETGITLTGEDARGLVGKDPGRLEVTSLDVKLAALEKEGLLKILSTPRVTTLNQKKANIHITENIEYISEIKTTITEGISETAITTKTLQTGITLEVTPTIGRDRMVTMEIAPKVSELVDFIKFSTGTTTLSLPTTQERTLSVTVKVMDGSTLVIGGLVRRTHNEGESHMPILGDLPLIGRLFSREDKSESETELIIFLTARIIPSGQSPSAPEMESSLWSRARPTGIQDEPSKPLDSPPSQE